VLLDAQVPEIEAVCAWLPRRPANSIVRRRAERIRAQLARGGKAAGTPSAQSTTAGELQVAVDQCAGSVAGGFLAALNGCA